ncbi:MAG: hypothetical protein RIC36_14770 [Rhodospirillales bacterium]
MTATQGMVAEDLGNSLAILRGIFLAEPDLILDGGDGLQIA